MLKNKAIKLVVIDLDHTLTNWRNKISKNNLDTLIKVQEHGIKLIIATGRGITKTISIAKELKIDQYAKKIVILNGSVIYDLEKNQTENKTVISREDLKHTIAIDKSKKISKVFIDENFQHYCLKKTWWVWICSFVFGIKIKSISLDELLEKKILSGFWIGRLKRINRSLKNNKISHITFSSSFPFTSQFSLTTKADSVLLLAKKWNINSDEIMAIGDSMNDYHLLKKIKYSVAVANSKPEIKRICNYFTDKWNKDGIAKAIKKIIF